MKKKDKINLLYQMIRMRKVEEKIVSEYVNQEMRCPVHLSIGQEAVSAAICANLNKSDQIVSAHRSHFHYLAKGGNLSKMISELYGKDTGCARGKGGSMHLIDINAGIIAAVPIVGSTIPIGVGLAWGNKLKNSKKIVVVFIGDGATEEGVFFESLNFASLHKLSVLFVCENNLYSVYTPLYKRQPKNRDIIKIANSFGIEGSRMDGNDVENIFYKTKKFISKIKKTGNPILLEFSTYRYLEHCGPNNDDNLNYRSKREIKYWKNKCPIETYKFKLEKNNLLSKNELDSFSNKINKEIDRSFNFAKNSKFPSVHTLKQHIYAK